jgi:CheY-like chemotaxis protein
MNEVILVVDDEDTVRNVVRKALEREGYTILDASDGAQALYICEAFGSPPDLIVSDIMMPQMNGGELVRELTKEGHQPRVLLMSGHADARIREAIGDVTSPFIQKPFTVEELQRRVREVLDAAS